MRYHRPNLGVHSPEVAGKQDFGSQHDVWSRPVSRIGSTQFWVLLSSFASYQCGYLSSWYASQTLYWPSYPCWSGVPRAECFFCGNNRQSRSKCPECDVTCSNCRKKGHFQRVCHGRWAECFFCGNNGHSRSKCPACDVTCSNCRKKGHFQRVCRGRSPTQSPRTLAVTCNLTIAMVPADVVPSFLTKSTTVVSINGFKAKAFVDSGSSESFIHPKLAESASLLVYPTTSTISMATSSLETKVSGFCLVDLRVGR